MEQKEDKTMEYVILNNGVKMPKLGFGTIQQAGKQVEDNVCFALQHGYTLIDTANRYGNEVEVGRAIQASGIKREDLFLETKLGPTLYETEGAVEGTLERLGLDYIDLMILHHPVNNYISGYKILEKAYHGGKIRAIGLSNFSISQIQEILDQCEVKPTLMQVECHPYYPAEAVKAFCNEHEIVLQSWFPLGHGDQGLLNEPIFTSLANKYGKSAVQVILRWHTQMGFTLVPGSKSANHIADNIDIFDFTLTDEEMQAIAAINKHKPYIVQTEESLHRLATTKCNFE